MTSYQMSKPSKKYDRVISKLFRMIYKLNPTFEKYEQLLLKGHILRPHYAYGLLSAAKEAVSLGYPKISVIEFGCAGGNGLVDLEYISNEISKVLDIQFELFGFDAGEGMPASTDYRDVLYIWSEGEFKMDQGELQNRLHSTKLVIGDVSDTVPQFFDNYNPAPIGAIFFDMDYYSATKNGLKIFDFDSRLYLPRVFIYLDDTLKISEFTGEMLAINEYNQTTEARKISIQNLLAEYMSLSWKKWGYLGKKFYQWHCFDHEKYSTKISIRGNMPLE